MADKGLSYSLGDWVVEEQILKLKTRIFRNIIQSLGLRSCASKQGPVAGSREHGTEHSSSIKGGEFIYYSRYKQLLNRTLLYGLGFQAGSQLNSDIRGFTEICRYIPVLVKINQL
jgi:hypothetical protein